MKITFLALHLGFGGVEKYIITIANMLSEKYEVEIIATYKTTNIPSFPVSNKVKVSYLIEGMVPNKEKIKKAIQSKNVFKIISEGIYALRLLRLKKNKNKKAVRSCTSNVIISTRDFHNNIIRKYAKPNTIKISTEHNHPCGDEKYINNVVSSLQGFDYFLPISKELTDFYKTQLKDTTTKVMYIPFCIDAPLCDSEPSFEYPTYISVGRLSKEKGVMDLIEIFNDIKKRQSNAKLHIVGDGDLMPQVVEKIQDYNLQESILVHGFLQKEKIDQLYGQSSIYLMTSYTESFGFVLLEAMACGLPCIAFDSAQGANEIIENGKNGYLIFNRDKQLFVETALQLIDDKSKLKAMSSNAKECIQKYSYECTKQSWLDLIEQIKNEHSM